MCAPSLPRDRPNAADGLYGPLEEGNGQWADLIAPGGVDWVQYPPRLARLTIPQPDCRLHCGCQRACVRREPTRHDTLTLSMAHFRLRFPLDEIPRWAKAYTYSLGDTEPVEIGAAARSQGYLTRPQFLALARWKSPRPAKHHAKNDAATIEAVTRFAFTTPVESLRLSALTLLKGVQPRTASAILHLCHHDPYPMMDVRAFWSLGIDEEPGDWAAAWPEYTDFCRPVAAEAKTDLRTLDRAQWGFSDHSGQVSMPATKRGRVVKEVSI